MEHNEINFFGEFWLLIVGVYFVFSGRKMKQGGIENLYFPDRFSLWFHENWRKDEYEKLLEFLVNPSRMKRNGKQAEIIGYIVIGIFIIRTIVYLFL